LIGVGVWFHRTKLQPGSTRPGGKGKGILVGARLGWWGSGDGIHSSVFVCGFLYEGGTQGCCRKAECPEGGGRGVLCILCASFVLVQPDISCLCCSAFNQRKVACSTDSCGWQTSRHTTPPLPPPPRAPRPARCRVDVLLLPAVMLEFGGVAGVQGVVVGSLLVALNQGGQQHHTFDLGAIVVAQAEVGDGRLAWCYGLH